MGAPLSRIALLDLTLPLLPADTAQQDIPIENKVLA
jgi:hypothetical protein